MRLISTSPKRTLGSEAGGAVEGHASQRDDHAGLVAGDKFVEVRGTVGAGDGDFGKLVGMVGHAEARRFAPERVGDEKVLAAQPHARKLLLDEPATRTTKRSSY